MAAGTSSRPSRAPTRITSAPGAASRRSASAGASSVQMIQVGASRAVTARVALVGRAQPAVEDDAHRRAILQPRQAHGELRVVRQHRADADHDRVGMGADQVRAAIRALAGDQQARTRQPRRVAIGGLCELQGDGRPPFGRAQDVAAMEPPRGVRQNAGDDLDAAFAQELVPAPAHPRVGVLESGHHAGDPRRHDRVDAGRRPAVMRAGLERDIERGAARRSTGVLERDALRVRAPARLGHALREDQRPLPVGADDQRADRGVRPGQAEVALAKRQRHAHEALVQGGVRGRPRPGALRTGARERDRAHASVRATLRGPGRFGAGSSAVSSPISSSKSFASRKFL